ncbi:MAG: hypothetical protein AUG51_22705 [Acidobacteria bacterium 13_1_20CM_3_53_8]|nr:MAG: hypothetical protein AUG51_22705 [Acidobacteria bacterium 13_1_20CM_3_53_8]
MQPEMSLLHAAVEHTMVNQEQESGHAKVNPMDSLGAMCSILLKLGVSPDSEYRGSTPFTSLFEHYWRSLAVGSITSPSQGMFDIAQAFLSAGQNPDVDIFRSPLKEGKSCKPLHILHSRFVVLLLQHKAAVNALDSSGRTALDLSIAHCDLRKPLFGITDADEAADRLSQRAENKTFSRRADEAFESTMLLIENGGCITTYGMTRLPKFLSELEIFYPIPDKFINIPYLQGVVADPLQRVQSSKVSPPLSQWSVSTPDLPDTVDIGTTVTSRSRLSPTSALPEAGNGSSPLRSILKVKTSHVASQIVSDVPNKSKNVVSSARSRSQVFSQQSYVPMPPFGRSNRLRKASKRSESVSEIQPLAKDVAENPVREVEESPTEKTAKPHKASILGHYRSISQPYRTKASRASGQEDVTEASKAELLSKFRQNLHRDS